MSFKKSTETKCKDCSYRILCPAIVGKIKQVKDDDIYCDMFKLDTREMKAKRIRIISELLF